MSLPLGRRKIWNGDIGTASKSAGGLIMMCSGGAAQTESAARIFLRLLRKIGDVGRAADLGRRHDAGVVLIVAADYFYDLDRRRRTFSGVGISKMAWSRRAR